MRRSNNSHTPAGRRGHAAGHRWWESGDGGRTGHYLCGSRQVVVCLNEGKPQWSSQAFPWMWTSRRKQILSLCHSHKKNQCSAWPGRVDEQTLRKVSYPGTEFILELFTRESLKNQDNARIPRFITVRERGTRVRAYMCAWFVCW